MWSLGLTFIEWGSTEIPDSSGKEEKDIPKFYFTLKNLAAIADREKYSFIEFLIYFYDSSEKDKKLKLV